MDSFVKQYCRLCLSSTSNENFEKISDFTIGSLNILLLKLDIDQNKHVICKVCALKVKEALTFKSMCLCTDNTIVSHVDDETGSSVDLIEIYAEEKGKELPIYDLYGHKVCRLCMQLIKGKFMCVHEVQIEAIEKYIPEINLNIIRNPVVCQQCFDSIGTHSSFLKNCLKVEEKIKSFYDSKGSLSPYEISSISCIKTEDSIIKQEETEYEEECMKTKFNIKILKRDDAYEINSECIDIKSEEDSERETIPGSYSTTKTVSETQMHECLNRDIETASKSELENQITTFQINIPLDPEDHSKVEHVLPKDKLFHCDKCSYATRYRSYLNRHQSRHISSQVGIYKCDKCSYESNVKYRLQGHQLLHKVTSEVYVYKCDECTFKTKHRGYIKVHQLKHTNPPIEEMYQCDKCSFVTKYRGSIRKHHLVHKDASQVQMYKCEKCNFETKRKWIMKKHESRHTNPSRQEMYQCDKCSFVCRYKKGLKEHQITHKDPSEFGKAPIDTQMKQSIKSVLKTLSVGS